MSFKGYITSVRSLTGVSQATQNLVIRSFCASLGERYLLSATEIRGGSLSTKNVLLELLHERGNDIMCFCVGQLDWGDHRLQRSLGLFLKTQRRLGFASERIILRSEQDLKFVTSCWLIASNYGLSNG